MITNNLYRITFTFGRIIPAIKALRTAAQEAGRDLRLHEAKLAMENGVVVTEGDVGEMLRVCTAAKREDSTLDFTLTSGAPVPIMWSHVPNAESPQPHDWRY